MALELAEFNTIITFLGMTCAMVQGMTGNYTAFRKKKLGLLKANDIYNRSHRAFGTAGLTFYYTGLIAGLSGFIFGILEGTPPVELDSPSYIIHTFPSFAVMIIMLLKTYCSYFNKKKLYLNKWIGPASFFAWAYTWITAAISYYLRTIPPNQQHSPPSILLPFELMWLMIALPFIIGGIFGVLIIRKAESIEKEKAMKKLAQKP